MGKKTDKNLALAFDTANGTISIGIGRLDHAGRSIDPVAVLEERADRSSNTRLLPYVERLFEENGLLRENLACIAVGSGPGSFTGVRIAVATAKGIAVPLDLPLVCISTMNAIAINAWASGVRGRLLVVDDAMRKEVYPAYFDIDFEGVRRISPDKVVKAADLIPEAVADGSSLHIAGDSLGKYLDLFRESASRSGVQLDVLPESLWEPTGRGLLLELERRWRDGEEILDASAFDARLALPVYTRLSDAEENERRRLSDRSPRDLKTGVQGESAAVIEGLSMMPFDAAYADEAAYIERSSMSGDAWSAQMLEEDLSAGSRVWWMSLDGDSLAGYAGALVAGDDMQLLKIAVTEPYRRRGIAKDLLHRLAEDGRNLGALTMSLEVRVSNAGAQAFYEAMGFRSEGIRAAYYSDGEDARIMSAMLGDLAKPDLAGLQVSTGASEGGEPVKPLILAIESSCDETAASVVDGESRILSDVVASQVDFHARFGGVVPEIASRKHIEAIAMVADMALKDAMAVDADPAPFPGSGTCAPARRNRRLSWHDLDAIAVTYAPGLIGALVVGVAFAKGASWALGIPLIAVNHLEGHLYANRLASGFEPPAVVSLVSGGNTMLVHMKGWGDYEILGGTIDDAVGEAFDKVAKAMGLPYPGGPIISQLASEGDPEAVDFPRALIHSKDYRFSLSGLKTAVTVHLEKERAKAAETGAEVNLPDICASFQQAVIDVQVEKARRALRQTGAGSLCIGGGVAANPSLRDAYKAMCEEEGASLSLPPLSACGDNAAMIGLVAQDRYRGGRFARLDLDAMAHADLSKPY